jgi:hypothetical protein
MANPDPLTILRVLVEAHAVSHPTTGDREPIWYLRTMGGTSVQHHAIKGEIPPFDEAVLQELSYEGLLDIEYLEHSWNLTPTPRARETIASLDRLDSAEAVADIGFIVTAVESQATSDSKLSWPAVRPVLAALRSYWESGGLSPYGIQLRPVFAALPEGTEPLFAATLRSLIEADYLRPTTGLSAQTSAGFNFPLEVELTEKARTVVDAWPGASPSELGENFIAILSAAIASEPDPRRKGQLEKLRENAREVGVSAAGEVLAKLVMGG